MKRLTLIAFLVFIFYFISSPAGAQPYRLWYDRPAQTWTQALPVGNGVIGGMVYGTPAVERIALNEAWSISTLVTNTTGSRLASEALTRCRKQLSISREKWSVTQERRAKSLNSKIKCFRAQVKGVKDIPFFMYRLATVWG